MNRLPINRTALLVLSTALLTITAFGQQPHAPHQPVAPRMAKRLPYTTAIVDQTMTGGLWIGDSGFKSAVYLRNSMKTDPITVTPVLYLGNGTHFTLAPVTLAPEATAIVDISQALIARNLTPSAALTGYVELQYSWRWAALCAFVRNVDTAHSIIFTSPFNPPLPVSPASIQSPSASVEGMWWKQEPNVSAFVALSNVTNTSIEAKLTADTQGIPLIGYTVALAPHTTSVVRLADLPAAAGTSGGIHIAYNAPDGSLPVNGGLEDLQTGYSANIPFVPSSLTQPAPTAPAVVDSTLAQLTLMSGSQNSKMHLPSATTFTPYSIAHNISSSPVTITPEIWWMADSVPKSAMLPAITLAAHQTQSLDPAALLTAARLYNFDGSFNLVLHTKGAPNALMLTGGSVDARNNYVFSVAPHTILESVSKSLSFWSTANGDDTMVTLWNPADEAQELTLRLTYSGGHYLLPVDLGAGETRELDLVEILHCQTPDAEGNVVPAGTSSGGAEIQGSQGEQEHILVAIDAGIYNAQKATCYSGCNTCNGYSNSSISFANSPLFPDSINNDQLTFTVQYNTGNQYDRTSQSNWTSSNTAMATVSNTGSSSPVSSGSSTITVTSQTSDPVYATVCNEYFPGCPIAYYTPTASTQATVPTPDHMIFFSDYSGNSAAPNPSCLTGTSSAALRVIQYQVFAGTSHTGSVPMQESFVFSRYSTCTTATDPAPTTCNSQGVSSIGVFSDSISTNACTPPDSYTCGFTLAPDQWQYCPAGKSAVIIAEPTYVVNESSVSVDGTTASQSIGSTVPK